MASPRRDMVFKQRQTSVALDAGIMYCVPWNNKPAKDNQLAGYMCISRFQQIDDFCIVQPYAPGLFSQGDLVGPRLMLDFHSGRLDEDAVKAEWANEKRKRKSKTVKLPEGMQLFCRGCSDQAEGREVCKPLKNPLARQ